jgi:2-polyprenyl-3-methyl-5-hydroxy-6-metoxy-1,4-benzoquinol methylase
MKTDQIDPVTWHNNIALRFAGRYQHSKLFRERLATWKTALESTLFPQAVVLDLGCGSGVFSIIASTMAERVIAIDGSEKMIDLAREDALRNNVTNIQFMIGRLEELPALVTQQVDVIICSSVFEYLPDPNAFLAACAAVLKPSGKILISVPNGRSWYRFLEWVAFKCIGKPRYYRYVKTVESENKMLSRLKLAGFHTGDVRYFGPAPLFSSAFRFFGKARFSDTLTLFIAEKTG